MEIEKKRLDEIHPYAGNAKLHPAEQVEQIKKSIEQFGNNDPIAVDEDGVIIEGHGRYLALKELGYDEAEVIVLKGMTEDEKNAYRLVHNQLTMNSGFDLELLEEELKAIDIDLDDYGISLEDFDIEEKPIVEDEPPEVDEDNPPQSMRGGLYKLGNHFLMCGDSTSEEDVRKLMSASGETALADLVFTDPPYGMGKEKDGVENDNLNFDDLLEFNKKWIALSFEFLNSVGSWYCWGIDEPLMDIYSAILRPMKKKAEITFRNLITWDKGNGEGQTEASFRMYVPADEKCLFVMRGVQGFNTNSDHYYEAWDKVRNYLVDEAERVGLTSKLCKEITGVQMYSRWFTKSQWWFITEEHYKEIQAYYKGEAFKKDYEELKKDYEELKKDYYETRAYFDNTHDNMNSVWHFDRTSGTERDETGGHATPKPIALCSRAIKTSSRDNERVLDLFGGSGSTLIACEQLGRKCYMMELSEKYCDVIIKRWENLTGLKAEKIA